MTMNCCKVMQDRLTKLNRKYGFDWKLMFIVQINPTMYLQAPSNS